MARTPLLFSPFHYTGGLVELHLSNVQLQTSGDRSVQLEKVLAAAATSTNHVGEY